LKVKGLEIVAVAQGGLVEDVSRFFRENELTFPCLVGGDVRSTKYGVIGIPTNYIIGPDGKVAAAFVGYNEAAIRRELEKLGVR
jgi:hypothetical protein